MSHTIWKYPFHIGDEVIIKMPIGAKVLCAQLQDGVPSIWARVNPKSRAVPMSFRVYGTGHPIPEDVTGYIGTFQEPPFVWHLFEDK